MSVRFPYSPARTPPVPAVVLDLASPDGSRVVPRVSAHLDTAADRTIVPIHLLGRLGLNPGARVIAHGFGGLTVAVHEYDARLDIPTLASLVVRAVGHSNEPYLLVGRDVLNWFRVTFDGPNQVVEFH